MAYKNLTLNFKKAQFVETSKEPKEGFERNDWTMNDKSGTNYKKFYKNVKGVVTTIKEDKVNFNGREVNLLKVMLDESGSSDIISLAFELWGDYGMDSDAMNMLGALRGMEKGEEVTITPVARLYTNRKGVEKKAINIYINYVNKLNEEGKGLSTGFIPYDEVPKLESEEKRGRTVYNSDARDDFYYDILKDLSQKFVYEGNNSNENTSAPSQPTEDEGQGLPQVSPTDAFEPATNFKPEEHDDLPF